MGARIRLLVLFATLTGVFVLFGWAIGAYFFNDPVSSIILFVAMAAGINAVSYFLSDRMVLWSYRAKTITEDQAPDLFRIVREVSQKAGLPMPKVAVVPSQTPNAFATGRNPNHAVVAVTQGILGLLTEDELRGVIAHEISHVKNRDILVMAVAATIAGAISYLAQMAMWNTMLGGGRNRNSSEGTMIIAVLGMILAPIAALLVQLAISRSRETKADYSGAKSIGQPLALASALQKLEVANKRHPLRFGSPASQGLFIVNPFAATTLTRLFRTHPPIEERIRRLQDLARGVDTY
jgi:heat shock protein HtpX